MRLAAAALRANRVALLVAVVVAACVAGTVRAEWSLVEEHFYALTLAGHPCGRSHERVERDGGRIRTLSRIEMRFTRLGEETVIDLASEFVEDARGEPIEASVRQSGAEPLRFVFESPRRARLERGAAREVRELPDADWLTPREAAAFVKSRGAAAAGEIRFRSLDVQSGFVIAEIAMKRLGTEKREVAGRMLELVRYEVRNSLQPIVASETYDADGLLIESSTPLGLGALSSRRVSRTEADAAFAAASFDLLAGTFVSSGPIERYETQASLALEVEASGGELIELPDSGAQRFRRIDARRARIEVEISRGSAAEPSDADDPRWRAPNELIDSDHPQVRALHASVARRDGESDAARAETLRTLVARHLRAKNLATAFGSASEAARTRSGDCTEHAVLLAALLRIDGIPSRVASGLVFVPDLGGKGPGWGWHLWTQALVGAPDAAAGTRGVWMDFDATLGGRGRGYHAAHILVATSDLAGGASDPAFARALSLIGGLRIRVEPVNREVQP